MGDFDAMLALCESGDEEEPGEADSLPSRGLREAGTEPFSESDANEEDDDDEDEGAFLCCCLDAVAARDMHVNVRAAVGGPVLPCQLC
jgi:hypothetical protein